MKNNFLFSGALAVGLYGNDTSHNGIDKIQSATKNISEVVNRVKNLVSIFIFLITISNIVNKFNKYVYIIGVLTGALTVTSA